MHGHFRDRIYYRCDAERGPDSPERCSMRGVPGDVLEEAVWDELASLLQGPSHLVPLVKDKQKKSVEAYQEARDQLSGVQQALSRLSQERSKVQTMYLEGIGTSEEVKAHIERLNRKRTNLEKERQNLEAVLQAQEVSAAKAQTLETLLKVARKKLWRSTPREKFELIHAFIERIEISPDGERATVRGILPVQYARGGGLYLASEESPRETTFGVENVPHEATFDIHAQDIGGGSSTRKYHYPDDKNVAAKNKVKPARAPRSNMSMPSRSRSTTAGADQRDRARSGCRCG